MTIADFKDREAERRYSDLVDKVGGSLFGAPARTLRLICRYRQSYIYGYNPYNLDPDELRKASDTITNWISEQVELVPFKRTSTFSSPMEFAIVHDGEIMKIRVGTNFNIHIYSITLDRWLEYGTQFGIAEGAADRDEEFRQKCYAVTLRILKENRDGPPFRQVSVSELLSLASPSEPSDEFDETYVRFFLDPNISLAKKLELMERIETEEAFVPKYEQSWEAFKKLREQDRQVGHVAGLKYGMSHGISQGREQGIEVGVERGKKQGSRDGYESALKWVLWQIPGGTRGLVSWEDVDQTSYIEILEAAVKAHIET